MYRPGARGGRRFLPDLSNIPQTEALLIVAGDVAGKGLKAGMLVALLVGAIRTATDTILIRRLCWSALNKRLDTPRTTRRPLAWRCTLLRMAMRHWPMPATWLPT